MVSQLEGNALNLELYHQATIILYEHKTEEFATNLFSYSTSKVCISDTKRLPEGMSKRCKES